MWTYRSSDGELSHNGSFQGTGYSGFGEGRNNQVEEWRPNIGPIPRGKYRISAPEGHEGLGPPVMRLTPDGHKACGRSGFLIHGDNTTHTASHGCIILGPAIRKQIVENGDNELEVI